MLLLGFSGLRIITGKLILAKYFSQNDKYPSNMGNICIGANLFAVDYQLFA
jgi:hypothetical protein